MGIINMLKRHYNSFFRKNDYPNEMIESYYKSRFIENKKYVCHAPFNNLYFSSEGKVANCWLTFDDPEVYSEDNTIKEIWNSEKFNKLRENIKDFNLSARCATCLKYLENNNHTNVLAKAYDNNFPITDFPSMMEFELSNTCNLECTMCTGLLSSAIRANREQLPKLKSPYGDKFVKELEEFIPHLKEARFNGGEPFLIKLYYDIWEKMIILNPECKMVIATNGTVLNQKVKETLAKGNFHLNISIDSLIPERYATIRVNGKLEVLLQNFLYFKEYCKMNNRNLCVMVNPMRTNWEELPDFVNFCNNHDVFLWFNTIVYPEELSIHKLDQGQLHEIYRILKEIRFDRNKNVRQFIFRHNTEIFRNFVDNQIKAWLKV